MIGLHLAVDHFETTTLNKVLEAELGCVGNAAEHRFTKKHLTQRDTIETTHEFVAVTAFDGMGVTGTMHVEIGVEHL